MAQEIKKLSQISIKDKSKTREQKLEKALNIAIKSLGYYADGDTYFAIGFFPDKPCGDFINDFAKIADQYGFEVMRPGKNARKTILKIAKLLDVELA